MNIDLIPAGANPPHSVNVLIEVPIGGEPVKYEFDKKSGAIFVDRILHTPMRYPCNYGFIPQTLCDDGDPLDCLVMTRWTLMPGTVIAARPVGVLYLEDEAGGDEKIIAVPSSKLTQRYDKIKNVGDLPEITVQQIQHFFEHYKDLEPGKWVKVDEWANAAEAERLVSEAFERFEQHEGETRTQGEGEAPNTL